MNKSPKVSVVTPAYNAENTIAESIQSVINQTFSDFDMIIIDDGSTDRTAEIIKSIEDSRIRYIYQDNAERAAARNLGIQNAKGRYIAFLDADDFWVEDKLEKQITLFRKNPELGLVYSDLYLFDDQSKEIITKYSNIRKLYKGRVALREMLTENFIQSPTPIVRREVFEQVGNFDVCLVPREDIEMWVRIVARYPIDYVNKPLAMYRIHKNSTTWKNKPELLFDRTIKMLDKIHNLNYVNEIISPMEMQKYRARVFYDYSLAMMSHSNYYSAIRNFWESINKYPYFIKPYIRILQTLFLWFRSLLYKNI